MFFHQRLDHFSMNLLINILFEYFRIDFSVGFVFNVVVVVVVQFTSLPIAGSQFRLNYDEAKPQLSAEAMCVRNYICIFRNIFFSIYV